MKKRNFLVSSAIICSILVFLFFLRPCCAKTKSQEEPIKIGVLLGMTGPVSAYFPKFKQGIELKVKELGGKVAGKPVQLIYEDHAGDITVTLQKTKKLIDVDKVSLILGPEFDGLPPVTGEYAIAHKVPSFNWKGYLVKGLAKFDYQFVLPWTEHTATIPLARYATTKLGHKTATLLLADYVAGYGFRDHFKKEFERGGGGVVQEQFAPIGTVDFGPYLINMKKADVAVMWSISPDIGRMLKQYAEFGLSTKIGTPLVILGTSLWSEEMAAVGDSILGAISVVDYTPLIDSPDNNSFVADFKAAYNILPDAENEVAYEATSLALGAIQAMGGTTPPEELYRTLLGLKQRLPSGDVSFTEQGWPQHNMYVVKAVKENGVYLWQPITSYMLDPLGR
jgi:branched-chain amino acid transport system substrate-binding protein